MRQKCNPLEIYHYWRWRFDADNKRLDLWELRMLSDLLEAALEYVDDEERKAKTEEVRN